MHILRTGLNTPLQIRDLVLTAIQILFSEKSHRENIKETELLDWEIRGRYKGRILALIIFWQWSIGKLILCHSSLVSASPFPACCLPLLPILLL